MFDFLLLLCLFFGKQLSLLKIYWSKFKYQGTFHFPARRSPLRLAKFLEQAFGPANFYGCSTHTPWFRANAVPDTNVQAGLPRLVDDRVREQTRNCDLRRPKPYDQNCCPAQNKLCEELTQTNSHVCIHGLRHPTECSVKARQASTRPKLTQVVRSH